jgi:AhpD family alkylhydroperoxidase
MIGILSAEPPGVLGCIVWRNGMNEIEQFKHYRERMNRRILSSKNLGIKRFFALDSRAYEKGALDVKTKEMLGLIASTVLRCNDCTTYHVIKCVQEIISEDEFFEVMNVALIVGGSITIPHIRRAVEVFDDCSQMKKQGENVSL